MGLKKIDYVRSFALSTDLYLLSFQGKLGNKDLILLLSVPGYYIYEAVYYYYRNIIQ